MNVFKETLTASKLRENIYRVLDEILKTGIPVEIKRHGKKLKIIPVDPVNKLSNLIERPYLKVSADEIVHLDWSDEWKSHDIP